MAEGVARAAITGVQEEWARHLGPGDFEQLLTLLRRLNAHVTAGDG
ncbi:hypothetical protein [Deinococcus apachensis]|nr:hypothetical protein [Deinococcus apachensis]